MIKTLYPAKKVEKSKITILNAILSEVGLTDSTNLN